MNIKTARDLKCFLDALPEDELDFPIYFDTEGKEFGYHLAKIGFVFKRTKRIVLNEIKIGSTTRMRVDD